MEISNQKFVKLYNPSADDEVIAWLDEREYAGFSVLRSYKKNTGFLPAVTKSGREDTKALIKIGVHLIDKPEKNCRYFCRCQSSVNIVLLILE